MANSEVFSLGGIVFNEINFEVPEDIELAKTTLGGTVEIPQTDGTPAVRASQTLGVVTDQIRFNAWFTGPNAEQNAELLEAMQFGQTVQTFQRGSRTYDVVVFRVSLKYHSANEINYEVELEALAETSATDATSSPSVDDAISDDTDAITDLLYDDDPGGPRLSASTAAAQNVLDQLQQLGGDYTGLAIQSSGIIVSITAAIDLLQAILDELAGSTVAADVTTYLFAASLLGALAGLGANLGAQMGTGTSSIATGGANLYELAVRFTGDISNSDAIAAVNNIADPFNLPASIVMPAF